MVTASPDAAPATLPPEDLDAENARLRLEVERLRLRVQRGEQRRRAMIHILSDLASTNSSLSEQHRKMREVLGDYEKDRTRLARQAERLDNSRRALLHILQDSHQSNLRLEASRKAMIHIMGDLADTTEEVRAREQDLRDKQEQLVQAGKLATLGELTTGVAHELNNPLNNIGLYIGNVMDQLERGPFEPERFRRDLKKAVGQVLKATEIISHLRTFGRVAVISREPVAVNETARDALSLMHEQIRLRDIEVILDLCEGDPLVLGNPIQLEQVFINLLGNARDAVTESAVRKLRLSTQISGDDVVITIMDSGPGIPEGFEQRIFDPFFTTKEVGQGTGLGLSITYGIVKEHQGEITVANASDDDWGAAFTLILPRLDESQLLPAEEGALWASEF